MLQCIPNISFLVDTNNSKIIVEFPLFDKDRLSYPQLEYLVDISQNFPIYFQFQILNYHSSSNSISNPTLIFPSVFNTSINLQSQLQPYTSSTLLFDYIQSIEHLFYTTWYQRQLFLLELQSLCHVTEYDAVDFNSFIIILKIIKNKMIIICNVQIILSIQYPTSLSNGISVFVHDIQHGNTYPIPLNNGNNIKELNELNNKKPSIIVKYLLIYIIKYIQNIAFDEK